MSRSGKVLIALSVLGIGFACWLVFGNYRLSLTRKDDIDAEAWVLKEPGVGITATRYRTITEMQDGDYSYRGRDVYEFENRLGDVVKMHLPLLGKKFYTDQVVDYAAKVRGKLNEPGEYVLKHGETVRIEYPVQWGGSGYVPDNGEHHGRDVLVFGIPAGADPDNYIVGSIATEPVLWVVERADE